MGKFECVLLASDFDGTLTGSDGKIYEKNIKAIRYFIAEGGKFTVSTGRTKIGFHKYSETFINAPVLLGNGAMAFDYKTEEIVFANPIGIEDSEILKSILTINFPVSMELYSVDHKAYVICPDKRSLEHFAGLRIADYKEISSVTEDIFPLVKVMLSVGERTYEVQRNLKNTDLGNMKYIPCDGHFVEILSEKAGKGKSLLQLADYFGFSPNDVYAVGDGSNDVDMLDAAAIGFVPESGERLAKDSADKIVCSSDDGAIAEVISFLDSIYN